MYRRAVIRYWSNLLVGLAIVVWFGLYNGILIPVLFMIGVPAVIFIIVCHPRRDVIEAEEAANIAYQMLEKQQSLPSVPPVLPGHGRHLSN